MSTNPNTVKSQHELNEGGRKSDVLLSTIEELERTKKQLECGVNRELLFLKKIEKLEKQLEKSLKLFKQIAKLTDEYPVLKVNELAHKGIEELNK